MRKKDWQNLDGNEALAEMRLSPHRGRVWRILSGVLFVASATFIAAYYLPLYRAHASLTREYRTLSTEATTQHKQLTETLDTLKQISTERDQLSQVVGSTQRNSSALVHEAENFEHDLSTSLKKYIGKGKLQVSRDKEKLRLSLASPALVHATSGDLTDTGKKVLCQVGSGLKRTSARIVVQGHGASTPSNAATTWKIANARASVAAQLMIESCGADPKNVEALVHDPLHPTDDSAISVEIIPR
jgi:chemotaxis protein MotB